MLFNIIINLISINGCMIGCNMFKGDVMIDSGLKLVVGFGFDGCGWVWGVMVIEGCLIFGFEVDSLFIFWIVI